MGRAEEPDGEGPERSADSSALDAGLREVFGGHDDETGSAEANLLKILARLGARGGRAGSNDSAVEDRYQLLGEIARGGIGIVLRGHDVDLGRDVAVKILRDDHRDDSSIVGRFIGEARIAGRLQHPGIVPVYELGLAANARPFIAMKLVEGESLAALLSRRTTPLEARRRFLGIFEQICHTVAYAHARGVLHRDLKPANVMVGTFGEVQVVDWGLAKALPADRPRDSGAGDAPQADRAAPGSITSGSSSAVESVEGAVLGTLAYMSPEQARGDLVAVDERSDVFSLGAILCEILTGRPPYRGDRASLLSCAAAARLDDAHRALEESGAEPELVELALQCLRPAKEQRPRNAAAVAARIAAHLAAVDERAREAQLAAAVARERAEQERQKRRLTLALAASIVGALVLAGGGWQWMERQERRRVASVERDVRAALADATLHRGGGRFEEARIAIARARARLDAPEIGAVDSRLAADVDAVGDAVELEAAAALLLEQVERVREPEDRFEEFSVDWTKVDRDFAAHFRAAGLDLDAMSADAARAALAMRGSAAPLAAALDEWSMARRFAGDATGARRLAEAAIGLDPDLPRASLRSALLRGVPDELDAFQHAPEFETMPASLLNLLGRALLEAGRLESAVAVYRRAQRRWSSDFVLSANLARRLLDLRPRRAIEAAGYLRAALALRPSSIAVRFELADLLRNDLDAPLQAADLMRDALELARDHVHLRKELALSLATAGDVDEALEIAEDNVRRHPRSSVAHEGLAIVHFRRFDFDRAIAACQLVIELDPRSIEGHHTLAASCLQKGELAGAVRAARAAIAVQPGIAVSRVVLGVALDRSGDHAGAVDELKEALRLDPEVDRGGQHLAVAKSWLARERLAQGHSEYALDLARDAVRWLDPEPDPESRSARVHARTTLAAALQANEDLDGALEASRRVASELPRDACCLAQQAFLLVAKAESVDEVGTSALRLAERAVEPSMDGADHADHYFTLALVRARDGHWEAALEDLLHPAASRIEDPAVAYLLARVNAELLREDEAKAWFENGERREQERRGARFRECAWMTPASLEPLRARLRAEAAEILGIGQR